MIPTIQINAKDDSTGTKLPITETICMIMTKHSLPANITIKQDQEILQHCKWDLTCTSLLNEPSESGENATIEVVMDYGFCDIPVVTLNYMPLTNKLKEGKILLAVLW